MNIPPSFDRLPEPMRAWAAATPDAPALGEEGRTWSYGDLARGVDEAADFLRRHGVRPGDRVMLIGENGIALAAFILAVMELDATAVLENARRAALEIDTILGHCDPRCTVFLTHHSKDALAHANRREAVPVRLPRVGPLAVAQGSSSSRPDARSGGPDDTAALIYTTGTTGVPKGVMLSHGNLLFLSGMMLKLRGTTRSDRIYAVLPITHVMGLATAFNAGMRAGAQVLLVPRFVPADCAAALQSGGVTVLQGAPAMFAKLVEFARRQPFTAPALRFISMGGAPLDATVKAQAEQLLGLTLHNGYGLTEGSGLAWTLLDQPRLDCSVGPPLPGVELRVVDAGGEPVAESAVGELWARGPQVMKGYYRNPELSARVLRPDGWFNTEDLARIGPDGHLHIEGRTRELIIAGGFNVYPLEVENALNAHPAIVHSAVVGRPEAASESVVAFIELAAGRCLALDGLEAFLVPRIAPYKRPRSVYVMPQLPTSPNGKVLKGQLRQMVLQDAFGDAHLLT